MSHKEKYIVGIDEAGRGPLAGPVSVGVFCAQRSLLKRIHARGMILRDSKKLSPTLRDAWLSEIKKMQKRGKALFAFHFCNEKTIDKINISNAGNLAAGKAFEKIFNKLEDDTEFLFLLDAGLRIDVKYSKNARLKKALQRSKTRSIIKGDEREPAISLASIVAKVFRDAYMQKMAKKYPQYGFENHKGYGTKEHIENIKKHGPSPIHRRTFLKNIK